MQCASCMGGGGAVPNQVRLLMSATWCDDCDHDVDDGHDVDDE